MRKAEIPWGCWRGNKSLPLTFSNNWKIAMASMADGPDVSQGEIRQAFQNPLGKFGEQSAFSLRDHRLLGCFSPRDTPESQAFADVSRPLVEEPEEGA